MSNKTNWNIPVPKTLDQALEEAVEKDMHSTKSDFVRDAVRRRLEELGFRPQVFTDQNRNFRKGGTMRK
jgi:Arc/MetJ-type ribon-helix-helix transcriptional regulator